MTRHDAIILALAVTASIATSCYLAVELAVMIAEAMR